MINQKTILQSINNYFNSITELNVNLDNKESRFGDNVPHIDIKYIAMNLEEITIGRKYYGGTLRIYIYEETPLKSYEVNDIIMNRIDGKTIDGFSYKLITYLQSPVRDNNGGLYLSILDFEVKTCNY